MFAVVVTLKIAKGEMAEFMPLIAANASSSRDEPGCQRFDVCTDAKRPDEVFLYEIYDDSSAFDAHLATDHFKLFDATTADMVADKDVRLYGEVLA